MIATTRSAAKDCTSTPALPAAAEGGAAPIRIGAVSYLNSKPLIEGLADLVPDVRLILDVPSRLADQLSRGALDVALIPSVEAFSDPDYEIVSDACVATRGQVLSVKLYSRVPLGEIKTLALDQGSRTSAALTKIMLAERYGVEPELHRLPLGKTVADTTADAILLIGDRAIEPPAEAFQATWDLGEEWLRWTGLPFVFAMWVTRKGVDLGRVEAGLGAARDLGLDRFRSIAEREAPLLKISEETAYNYFEKNLHFRLGSAERSGLRLFSQLAAQRGLIPPNPELRFRAVRELEGAGSRLPRTAAAAR
ncbi:menaquinone biosynthetic enzyme MqnA/MqnD family protein [Planctomyces sp. SH-PL14]|uniref:menaquinone biosynthetic enzyme MqnA/MqnD family protein n=1 Tax=Planctomyces sp. SH-PL14 TaxID=1632864 RepID=UPI00078CB48C|nr:menaquinone biosynthesis protein [Planctomyces sp. SH-PL14]AMV19418.1 Chorismate dehydratase [Planctomyces sp. SH-PL14]